MRAVGSMEECIIFILVFPTCFKCHLKQKGYSSSVTTRLLNLGHVHSNDRLADYPISELFRKT